MRFHALMRMRLRPNSPLSSIGCHIEHDIVLIWNALFPGLVSHRVGPLMLSSIILFQLVSDKLPKWSDAPTLCAYERLQGRRRLSWVLMPFSWLMTSLGRRRRRARGWWRGSGVHLNVRLGGLAKTDWVPECLKRKNLGLTRRCWTSVVGIQAPARWKVCWAF